MTTLPKALRKIHQPYTMTSSIQYKQAKQLNFNSDRSFAKCSRLIYTHFISRAILYKSQTYAFHFLDSYDTSEVLYTFLKASI